MLQRKNLKEVKMLVSAVSMNGVIPSIKNSKQSNPNSVSKSNNDTFQKSQVSFGGLFKMIVLAITKSEARSHGITITASDTIESLEKKIKNKDFDKYAQSMLETIKECTDPEKIKDKFLSLLGYCMIHKREDDFIRMFRDRVPGGVTDKEISEVRREIDELRNSEPSSPIPHGHDHETYTF